MIQLLRSRRRPYLYASRLTGRFPRATCLENPHVTIDLTLTELCPIFTDTAAAEGYVTSRLDLQRLPLPALDGILVRLCDKLNVPPDMYYTYYYKLLLELEK